MKISSAIVDEVAVATPKYYEVNGESEVNKNRAWILALIMAVIAVVSLAFACFVRLQPPTVIRIGLDGEAIVVGKPAKGGAQDPAKPGNDPFLNEAFAKRFLSSYLNYSATDVDERWAASLNMMTRNLRAYTIKAMADDNTRGKIDDGQVQSTFHLREINPIPGEPLAYLIYGVKDVHHLDHGNETTDHLVNEYRVRLIADHRTDINPDGLWVAEYSERRIDGERRDQILATADANSTTTNGGQ
jgi:hypothetical protein